MPSHFPQNLQITRNIQPSRSPRSVRRRVIATVGSAALLLSSGIGATSAGASKTAVSTAVRKVAVVPFRLSSSASLITVAPATSTTLTISSSRDRGFTSSIYLGLSGIPKGVTVKLSRNPLTTGSPTTTVIVTPSATFTPRTFTVSVSGSSKGKTARASFRVAVGGSIPTVPPATLPPVPTTTVPSPTIAPTTTVAPATTTSTTLPVSDYTLVVEPTAVTLAAGGSATATLRINRTGGFNQALDTTIEGLPTGMTGSVDTITGSTVSSTVRLVATTSVIGGTYDLTIRARGRSAVLRVNVTGNALGALPATLTVGQGSTGNSTLTLGRNVSASVITWSVDVLPVGVTATFTPNSTTAVSTVMTLAASASAGAGTYIVTLRAGADGGSVTSPFTLIVSPAAFAAPVIAPASLTVVPGGSSSVTVTPPTNLPVGTPNLAVTGFPTGTAAVISISGTSFIYTFSLPAATPVATYPVTFQITQGGATSTGTFTLIVSTTAATAPTTTTSSFVVSVGQPSVTVPRGATGVITVLVSWGTGVVQQPISFSTFGGPVGNSTTYTSNPSALGTTLNFTVPASAATGTYIVSVSGNVPGIGTSVTSFTLNVT